MVGKRSSSDYFNRYLKTQERWRSSIRGTLLLKRLSKRRRIENI